MAYVLVHGGGFDRRCWDPLLPLLDAPAFAVDLPGRGSRPADLDRVTIADFAEAVAAEITERDLDDVVLVGHSLAGITLPGVAGRVGDRLRHLVFVSCAVPPDGASVAEVLDSLSPAVAEVAGQITDDAVSAEGTLHPDLAGAMFCNDMDDALRASTLELLVPEAFGVLSEPVDLSPLGAPIPRTYVRLLQDASLTLDAQDRMVANLGGARVVDLDAGHMAMISRPADLSAILAGV